MSFILNLAQYIFVVSLPILFFYIIYLIVTKAFNDMGFCTLEAVVIIFISYILGSGLLDSYLNATIGCNFSNIYLFTYNNWDVGINTGGALIPILLSTYLIVNKRLPVKKLVIALVIVSFVTFLVTTPVPEKGIVAYFPYWLLPAFVSGVSSIFLLWKNQIKAAPFAYVIGTLGVLIGADFFHLPLLLSYNSNTITTAVIGGANVFDMVFITGILAVFVDGILTFNQKFRNND